MSGSIRALRRRPMATRLSVAAVGTLMAVLGLSACAPPSVACPAIGWVNELTVQLEGDVSDVAEVQLCIDAACIPSDTEAAPEELAQVAPMSDGGGAEWVFTTGMSTPDAFTVRVLSTDGTILTEAEAAPEWVRVGGTEQCGGPGEATVVVQM